MSCSVVKYGVVGGRHRQFISSVTSLWKILITKENRNLSTSNLETAEKIEMDQSKGMKQSSVFTSPWWLMVWFAYEQWEGVKEGLRPSPVPSSCKQLDMELARVHVLFAEALCKRMLRVGARKYEAWLLVRGKRCVRTSLLASPDADRSGRLNDASKMSLILQLWLALAWERAEN